MPVDQVSLAARCPACGAAPGMGCRARSGKHRGEGRHHRARRVEGRRLAAQLDCRTCGACCTALPWWTSAPDGERSGAPVETYTFVNADPDTPEEACVLAERSIANRPPGRALRVVGGRCASLVGDVGLSVRCAIYERRPLECRGFPRGSIVCRIVRVRAGLEPERGRLR